MGNRSGGWWTGRFNLVHLVLLITGVAAPCSALGQTMVAMLLAGLGLGVLLCVALPIYLIQGAVASVTGVPCPGCGAAALERVAVVPLGARYFVCRECGLRCKHEALGGWAEANGPADARHYRPRSDETRLELEPWRDEGDQAGAPSIDALVRNQRHRHGDG